MIATNKLSVHIWLSLSLSLSLALALAHLKLAGPPPFSVMNSIKVLLSLARNSVCPLDRAFSLLDARLPSPGVRSPSAEIGQLNLSWQIIMSSSVREFMSSWWIRAPSYRAKWLITSRSKPRGWQQAWAERDRNGRNRGGLNDIIKAALFFQLHAEWESACDLYLKGQVRNRKPGPCWPIRAGERERGGGKPPGDLAAQSARRAGEFRPPGNEHRWTLLANLLHNFAL